MNTVSRSPSAMSRYALDRHKRACRALGFALVIDQPQAWHQLSAILGHRLTRRELVSVSWAALSALEPEAREAVYEAAQWGST